MPKGGRKGEERGEEERKLRMTTKNDGMEDEDLNDYNCKYCVLIPTNVTYMRNNITMKIE